MLKITEDCLSRRCRFVRYFFYLISGFRFKSFRSWSQEGEPNPFVAKTYRAKQTERVDFVDIFDDIN